ncbi:MAG: SurA N-terminal domain-containing protein [Calditrichae bacterium]|nr:SurA N-terminal domain-containing protein [Calditrichota bacterium]MCB9059138.1 SurA N-terminal domain-containing protein [Calditrichia bacterium]
MMTQMRQMSKAVFIIIAVAFIGLIVFEWGADVGRGGADTTVGEVNGRKLSYNEFNDMYQNVYQNERARTQGEIDERTLDALRNRVWDQFVQSTLLQEEMDKLNIAVTDSEIVYQIMNYPLDELKQNPGLQTNGVFDMSKYRAALNDPNVPWNQIEEFYRQQIPFKKLQNIITNSVRVSESEIKDDYFRKNIKAKVEYLAILSARFQSNIEASDAEIEEFYKEHKDEYKQNEQRDLAYVVFEVKPTHADTNRIFEDVATIKERLSLGEDFNTLALEFSEDPTVNKNKGDLGFFDRKTMVKPFTDAAFDAKVGDLVGPVETQFGYHLIKIEDKKTENGVEKVKASHILLKITPGSSTMIEKEDQAKLFAADAEEMGWDAAVNEMKLESKSTGFFEEQFGNVPGFGRNTAVSAFAFISNLNTISSVYSVDQGYAVFKVNGVKESGIKPLEDVKQLIENRVKLEKAKELAHEYAQKVGEKVSQDIPFKEIADADTSKKVTFNTTPLFSINQSVSGVGRYPEFSATAFNLEVGQKSGLIEAEYGYYFQKLLEKTPFDSSAFNAQKPAIKTRLLNEKKNQIFTEWYNKLKEEATIVDNRKKFGIY